jgi:hypothetical protein
MSDGFWRPDRSPMLVISVPNQVDQRMRCSTQPKNSRELVCDALRAIAKELCHLRP